MRYFNTHGPVNETEHYVVPRKELVTEIAAKIEEGIDKHLANTFLK